MSRRRHEMRVPESVTVPQMILTHCSLPFYRQGSQASETLNHLPKVTLTAKYSSFRTQFRCYSPDAPGQHSRPVMGSHSSPYCFMDLITIVTKEVIGK